MSWQRTEQPGHGEGRGVGATWQRGYPSGHVGRAYLNGDWTLRDARGYLVARGRRMALVLARDACDEAWRSMRSVASTQGSCVQAKTGT